MSIVVALDWTPNTNHTGFFVAQSKKCYEEEGLKVSFVSPGSSEYKPPAKRVRDGSATFAVAPSETVISSHTQTSEPQLQAVAALLQEDTSAIVTLKSSGLDRPAKLDGKRYASYGARYEGRIVQQLIKNDGGQGIFDECTPPVMGIWDTILKGEADATWIFRGWEGIDAQLKSVDLNMFELAEFGVPYGYTPTLVTLPEILQQDADKVKAFLRATAKGFKYAAEHPAEAAELLIAAAPEVDSTIAKASQEFVSKCYLDAQGRWGHMESQRWDAFLDWLSDNGLLTSAVPSRTPVEGFSASLDDLRAGRAGRPLARSAVSSNKLFTNEFLP